MAEVCRAADGLIDPSQIPGLLIQPGVIGSAASAFTGAAGLIRERGAAVVTSWSTLSTVYSAPEAEQLLNVMSPVSSDTAVLSDQVSSIGSELAVLAETVEPIQQSLIGIRDRADVFVAKAVQGTTVDYWDPNHPAWDDGWFVGFMLKDFDEMVPAHIPWDKYQPWIDENNALIAEVNAQVALLDEARVACVNAINRLRADVCVAPEQAITVEQLNAEGAELPWGTQGNGDRSCYESVNDGISESFSESVAGLGSLISRNPETGEWGDWASAGANWVQLGATLGAIVLVGPVMPLLANTAPKGSWGQEFAQGVVDRQVAVVEGLVGSPEEWQENPAKAAGSAGFNIGTFFIPGAGAVGGAAKAGLLGARAASLLERATVVLGAGGKVVSEAAGAAVSKVGALLSDTLNVLKSGGHVAKAELDALFAKLEGAIDNVKTHFTQPESPLGGSAPGVQPVAQIPDAPHNVPSHTVPSHTGLDAPPAGATGGSALPDLSDVDAKYRDPQTGFVRESSLDDWASEVSARYPALTQADVLGAYDYTTGAYKEMNGYLRGLSTPADIPGLEARLEATTNALSKLPPVPGTTFRGMSVVDGLLDKFEVGKTWSDPGFMSSSVVKTEAVKFSPQILVTIEGRSGLDVAPISAFRHEAEILFQRETKFEVMSKSLNPRNGRWEITLREIAP